MPCFDRSNSSSVISRRSRAEFNSDMRCPSGDSCGPALNFSGWQPTLAAQMSARQRTMRRAFMGSSLSAVSDEKPGFFKKPGFCSGFLNSDQLLHRVSFPALRFSRLRLLVGELLHRRVRRADVVGSRCLFDAYQPRAETIDALRDFFGGLF